jgi:hypothetical protein
MECKKIFFKCLVDIDSDTTEQYKNPLPKTMDKLSPQLIKIHEVLIDLSRKDNRGSKGLVGEVGGDRSV